MKPVINQCGKVIAYVNDVSPYRQEIRSKNNALLGHFNPKVGQDGKTFDRSGRSIGSGDQRGRLITGK